MGLQQLRGHSKYPIKVHFKRANRSDKLTHTIDDELYCYCSTENFQKTIENANGSRFEHTTGTLKTNQLKEDEIDIDWLVIIDGKEYIIDSYVQNDENENQQHQCKNNILITEIKVRC